MVTHGRTFAVVSGEERPALSIGRGDNIYTVFFSECRLDLPADEWPEGRAVCLGCLIEDGDDQLAQGLDLATVHGQVDWDAELGEWFAPNDTHRS
jgi:hypothetical protein